MAKEDLPPELREKANACKTPDELLDLIKHSVIELDDWQLEHVVGGVDAIAFDPRTVFGIEQL